MTELFIGWWTGVALLSVPAVLFGQVIPVQKWMRWIRPDLDPEKRQDQYAFIDWVSSKRGSNWLVCDEWQLWMWPTKHDLQDVLEAFLTVVILVGLAVGSWIMLWPGGIMFGLAKLVNRIRARSKTDQAREVAA